MRFSLFFIFVLLVASTASARIELVETCPSGQYQVTILDLEERTPRPFHTCTTLVRIPPFMIIRAGGVIETFETYREFTVRARQLQIDA